MKIVFYGTRSYDKITFRKENKNFPNIEILYLESNLNERTLKLAESADAICVFVNANLNSDMIQKISEMGIKLILLRCAGFNNVDLIAAKKYNLQVMRVPGYSPESVAEMAATLLLSVNRRIHKAYTRVRDNNFSLTGLSGYCLYGKKVGIIGYGRIGRCFANICRGLGMTILAYDPHITQESIKNEKNTRLVDLDTLYKESDIISLHTILNDDTYHMIDSKAINKMKDNVILINVSRGGLIDNDALIEGIRAGKFFGVGLDVYEGEDDNVYINHEDDILLSSISSRLSSFPNVLLTSHQAFLTDVALEQIAKITLQNADDFQNKKINKNELII